MSFMSYQLLLIILLCIPLYLSAILSCTISSLVYADEIRDKKKGTKIGKWGKKKKITIQIDFSIAYI